MQGYARVGRVGGGGGVGVALGIWRRWTSASGLFDCLGDVLSQPGGRVVALALGAGCEDELEGRVGRVETQEVVDEAAADGEAETAGLWRRVSS